MLARTIVGLVVLAVAADEASAFDCAKATTAVELAICADAGLKLLDDRLEAAYAEVRSLSSGAERKMLARAQKRWIGEREAQCPAAAAGLDACIADMTDTRLALFEGRPDSGPGSGGRLYPVFIVQDGSSTQYELDITMLRFAAPASAGERLFNEVADQIDRRVKRGNHGEETDGRIYALDEAMAVRYASPRLISVMHSFWSDTGGAHGNGGVSNTTIDMAAGKVLDIGDLFGEDAVAGLAATCREQIVAQKAERLAGEAYDPATDSFLKDEVIAEHVATLSRWSLTEHEASVSFDAYAIGSYAEGSYDCTFPMTQLKALAVPGAPLP